MPETNEQQKWEKKYHGIIAKALNQALEPLRADLAQREAELASAKAKAADIRSRITEAESARQKAISDATTSGDVDGAVSKAADLSREAEALREILPGFEEPIAALEARVRKGQEKLRHVVDQALREVTAKAQAEMDADLEAFVARIQGFAHAVKTAVDAAEAPVTEPSTHRLDLAAFAWLAEGREAAQIRSAA